jgi:hypothetical protein
VRRPVERAIRWLATLDREPVTTHGFPLARVSETMDLGLSGNAGKVPLVPAGKRLGRDRRRRPIRSLPRDERLAAQRRLAKLTTGHRTSVDVPSIVPRPAAAAAVMSSSLLSSVGVTPGFQWKICRFQAPPA